METQLIRSAEIGVTVSDLMETQRVGVRVISSPDKNRMVVRPRYKCCGRSTN